MKRPSLTPNREAWDVEHQIPVALIGAAAETDDNRRPAHRRCHKVKSKVDAGNLARAVRREARHVGARAPSRTPLPCGRRSPWRKKMTGEVVPR